MDNNTDPYRITDIAALERIYGAPSGAAVAKELDYLHPHYQLLIAKSPFAVLATAGPGGLDTSPRGDAPGFVVVENEKTLLLPDRKGNNRIDSLRNIVADCRVALLFMIPGIGETLRVNGRAAITTAPAVLERFRMEGALPRSVIVISVETVFFQCSRALWRSKLWDPATQIERASLPSLGAMVEDISGAKIKAAEYDRDLYPRLKSTLY